MSVTLTVATKYSTTLSSTAEVLRLSACICHARSYFQGTASHCQSPLQTLTNISIVCCEQLFSPKSPDRFLIFCVLHTLRKIRYSPNICIPNPKLNHPELITQHSQEHLLFSQCTETINLRSAHSNLQ